MKRCRLKRSNLQIKIKMSKDNKTSDKQENGNDFIADVSKQRELLVCSCGSIKVQTTGGSQCPNNRCSSAN
jgi:hypothetical protein